MLKTFISPEDIKKNQKKTLQSIATNLTIPSDKNATELYADIWNARQQDDFERVLEKYKDNIFSHKGSFVYYKIIGGDIESYFDSYINEYLTKKNDLSLEAINNEPQVVSAYRLNENETIIKFIYRLRNENRIENDEIVITPIIKKVNVVFDSVRNMFEVRSTLENAEKIIKYIGASSDMSFELININENLLIDSLGATLQSSKGNTNIQQIALSESVKSSLINVVEFLNNYLSEDLDTPELEMLYSELDIIKSEEMESNFILLLLSGLGSLDLASIFTNERTLDLTENSLFKMVEPFINKNSCYISVPYESDGLTENFTLNLSMEKNTITFLSTTSEDFIRHIRQQLI